MVHPGRGRCYPAVRHLDVHVADAAVGQQGEVAEVPAGHRHRPGLRVPVEWTAHAGRAAADGQASLRRELDEGEAARVLLVEAQYDAGTEALAVHSGAVVNDDVAGRHVAHGLAIDRQQAEERVEVGQRRATVELQPAAVEADAHLRRARIRGRQDRHARRRRLAVRAVDRHGGEVERSRRAGAAGGVENPACAQGDVGLRIVLVGVLAGDDAQRAGIHEEVGRLGAAAVVQRQRDVSGVVHVGRGLAGERHVEGLAVAVEVPLRVRGTARQGEHGQAERACGAPQVSQSVHRSPPTPLYASRVDPAGWPSIA